MHNFAMVTERKWQVGWKPSETWHCAILTLFCMLVVKREKGGGGGGGGGLTCVYSELFKAWSGASRRKGGRAQQLRLLGAVV